MQIQTVLFLCRGNSCRSIMAEAIFNALAKPPLQALSAGSHPAGVVNVEALATLKRHGLSDQGYQSKGIDAIPQDSVDMVITLCDEIAGEVCPLFIGKAIMGHWGVPDPSLFEGAREEIVGEFDRTYRLLRRRIEQFLDIPLDRLNQDKLQEQLRLIGRLSS